VASSPSVTLDQILAEVSYGVDVMGRLPRREDVSVYSTLCWSFPSLDPPESPLLDFLLESSSLDPLLESSSLSQS